MFSRTYQSSNYSERNIFFSLLLSHALSSEVYVMHWSKSVDTELSEKEKEKEEKVVRNSITISLTFERVSIVRRDLNDFLFVAVVKFSTLVRRAYPKSNRVLLARGRHVARVR